MAVKQMRVHCLTSKDRGTHSATSSCMAQRNSPFLQSKEELLRKSELHVCRREMAILVCFFLNSIVYTEEYTFLSKYDQSVPVILRNFWALQY